jgi:hypothetical protein
VALSVKVGNFQKTTSAATASQSVTGVGFTPKGLILWTVGSTALNTSGTAGVRWAVGLTSGASESYSYAAGMDSAASPSNTSERGAAKALTIVAGGESTVAECDLTSFDSDGFTLSWTTNDANARYMGYLAFGGDFSCKVLDWTAPTATGAKSVTGAGFQPDALVTIGSGRTSLPSSGSFAELAIGAYAKGGLAWGYGPISNDGSAGTTATRKYLELGAMDVAENGSFVGTYRGEPYSLDADGFTLHYAASGGSAVHRATMCLKGGVWGSGVFNHALNAATANQTVTTTGLTPVALIMATANFVGINGPVQDNQFSFGATDGTNAFATCYEDPQQSVAATNKIISNSGKGLINGAGTISSECSVPSFATQSFSLAWTTNSTSAVGWVTYLVVGTAASGTGGAATNLVGGVLVR